jgi:hypothetical protein
MGWQPLPIISELGVTGQGYPFFPRYVAPRECSREAATCSSLVASAPGDGIAIVQRAPQGAKLTRLGNMAGAAGHASSLQGRPR